MQVHDLAAMLHKFVAEVEDMTLQEFLGWQVWWQKRHGND